MQPGTRPQGVMIPAGQINPDRGEPNKVYNVAKMTPYAIEYTDEHGGKHTNIAYLVGDVVYLDQNGERWTAGLRQATGYIKEAVTAAANSAAAPIPEDDSVDVMDQAESPSGEAPTAE